MSISPGDIVFTGGGGRLGSEIKQLLPGIVTPDLPDFDITDYDQVESMIALHNPKLVVHAAAYTNVSGAEENRDICWKVNVDGTRNIVRVVSEKSIFLIHISTDYVFYGDKGQYREDDPVGPVRNYYSLSKLVAEAIARMAQNHLVIRTSFRPREWPYDTAFTDVYTSQDYVDIIAPEITLAIQRHRDIPYSTIHIATERKSVYDLAKRRRPDVQPGTKKDVNVKLPDDISLDITRWQKLKEDWGLI